MGHLSLSEIAVQFVNTELIARCYNHIFTWRGYAARFQEEVDQSEALLKTCQPGEWMQTFSRLQKRGDLKAMQEFLKEDFLRHVQLMTNACRQLRERRKVLDIFAFNKAVNQMLSLCSFVSLPEETLNAFYVAVSEVLDLYPDNGYDPDADDFYEERVLDGSVVYGDREIGLREKQVVAEQNMLIKKTYMYG